ncbi:MAG TPA: hypothetical protein VFS21_40355 [Roseiflexaceae bacterium]|nr:hypothetical protein [Roseiflexaceae bacterium]
MSAPAGTPQPSQQQPQPANVPQTLLNVIEQLARTGRFSPTAADELRRLYSR